MRQPESILRQFRVAPVAKLFFQHMTGIDDRAFAGQQFHFAEEGFQIIERNAFVFVIGGIEIKILPYFADKIVRLISRERILFALVISRIEIVIRFGCLWMMATTPSSESDLVTATQCPLYP